MFTTVQSVFPNFPEDEHTSYNATIVPSASSSKYEQGANVIVAKILQSIASSLVTNQIYDRYSRVIANGGGFVSKANLKLSPSLLQQVKGVAFPKTIATTTSYLTKDMQNSQKKEAIIYGAYFAADIMQQAIIGAVREDLAASMTIKTAGSAAIDLLAWAIGSNLVIELSKKYKNFTPKSYNGVDAFQRKSIDPSQFKDKTIFVQRGIR